MSNAPIQQVRQPTLTRGDNTQKHAKFSWNSWMSTSRKHQAKRSGPQTVVPGPADSSSPRKSLENKFSDPSQIYWIRNSGGRPCSLCFNMPTRGLRCSEVREPWARASQRTQNQESSAAAGPLKQCFPMCVPRNISTSGDCWCILPKWEALLSSEFESPWLKQGLEGVFIAGLLDFI